MFLFRVQKPSQEAARRGIRLLLHSTHLYKNLPQILSDGLLHTAGNLKKIMGEDRAARYLHDPRRYESFRVGLDYLNSSLTVPNFELLYHRSKANWPQEWVHLAFSLSLIDRDDTLFSPVSAAAEFGKHVLSGLDGFRAMFSQKVEGFSRESLPKEVPTHPQAEVLVRGPLPISVIETIHVSSGSLAGEVDRLANHYGHPLKIEISPHLFVWPKRLMKE